MTSKHSPLTELMHAVLDGEASDAEARDLDMRLAADPAARAEFEEWKRLFAALDGMPKEHAPEGLVASIAAAMPEARGAARQPFPDRRVLGYASFESSPRTLTRSTTMTEQSSRRIFAHRKAWLGAGIAAAAAVVVAQIAFDFPVAKDVVGTVVPAERYRAAQNGSEQVQLGTRAGEAAPTGTVPDAGHALAEKSAAESALRADRTAAEKMSAERMAAEKTSADRMAAEKMSADRMAAEKMSADRMAAEKMSADRMAAEKMSADRMAAQKTSADRMAAEKMSADRMAAQKTSADRAAAEKTADRMQQ